MKRPSALLSGLLELLCSEEIVKLGYCSRADHSDRSELCILNGEMHCHYCHICGQSRCRDVCCMKDSTVTDDSNLVEETRIESDVRASQEADEEGEALQYVSQMLFEKRAAVEGTPESKGLVYRAQTYLRMMKSVFDPC